MVKSVMAQANLPISFWGDALSTAAYVLNRVPSKSVPSTPYELWNGNKPNLGILYPWGCAAYIHNNTHQLGNSVLRGKSVFSLDTLKPPKDLFSLVKKLMGA